MPDAEGSPDAQGAADVSRQVVVGRIGRPHGVRGEVSVEVRTDDPDRRFAPGSRLLTANGPALVVTSSRPHSGRLLVAFEGIADRNAAEQLRGSLLLVDVSDEPEPSDPDEFFDHQLVGLAAITPAGQSLGVVSDVVHLPEQDLLVVTKAGVETFVPFVQALVPAIDLAAQRLVIDPPAGLFASPSDAVATQ